MTDIVVSTDDESPGEEIAEAVEQVAEQQQSFEIGVLVGRVSALEEKVEYHDALIQLHSHDGLATQDESTAAIMEAESRIVDRIDSLAQDDVLSEAEEQAIIDSEVAESNESEAEQAEESNDDEPPRSRAKRTPLAERYYKSSKL